MLNNEEALIRYLMREMDPSEEIEFEREMLKDEDLLIEVESLRKTYQKLGKLPLLSPPRSLTNQITQAAVSKQQARVQNSRIWVMNFPRAVASVAAAIMIVSGTYLFGGFGEVEEVGDPALASQTVAADDVTPWVNRNDVLMFSGTAAQPEMTESVQTDITQSFDKLRLVNSETGYSPPSRKIVLTNVTR